MKKTLLLVAFTYCGVAVSAQTAKPAALKPLEAATSDALFTKQTPEQKKQADYKKNQAYKMEVELKQKQKAAATKVKTNK